ncbi:putative COP9 signalosome complex subunit [Clavispora lusitaniae]|uniref:JAB1/MPN/MOV34 metalloenzyme domain-containing protein n=3 Tax=Clavispora lusitaniae TaxID=36911 RepID=C4Y4K2_CLAL4|nr:uncharacterized protein CLUG_02574 [Clavispora lusitaniae ATCC 42720]KAF5211329.1 hypothetical protein E0198_002633 [Clavispora lusitaniae]EEQ38448.1 hypothetical protein CLUG_02574 [Clavispora lusitaniae ATCC 42720]KAF7580159.1 JAB1/Mov34/MPN/PAD-1 ubiquitin protease family protein [Clavispora lusitaniae]OVF08814.1 putative eukaryotic translation initiation factor subunit [Clavispora lusitaniae]QFZ27721.1 putative COP9 signalosome complex subunit [Clavispora lusitaniae]
MPSVSIRPVSLFAISDHVSRKSPFEYGVLIGSQTKENITVHDAFELKTDKDQIDFAYLEKRLGMISTVSPFAQLVGLYTIGEDATIPESFWEQFSAKEVVFPSIYLTCNGGETVCFCSQTREEIRWIIASGETDEIATATIHNHKNYTSGSQDLVSEPSDSLLTSLEHLRDRVQSIVANDETDVTTESKLVHLANIVSRAPEDMNEDTLSFFSAKLALLTNQISAVKTLDISNSRKIATYSIGAMQDRPR